jgi:hypothetical protein
VLSFSNQNKQFLSARDLARDKSGDEEELTVVGPKYQPTLLLKRWLDKGKRTRGAGGEKGVREEEAGRGPFECSTK